MSWRARARWAALALTLIAALASAAVLALGGEARPQRGAAAPASDAGYTVEMSPVGAVRFPHVPRRVITMDANYNDMLVAVDQEGALIGTGYEGNFFDGFYAQLPGVQISIDRAALQYVAAGGLDKEVLYALRADVHHIDPTQLLAGGRWTQADLDEITRNVGPFFANRYSRENSYSGTAPYTYYSLWALSEKVAEVYQRPAPIAALKALYDEMARHIEAKLPPEDQRPSVGLVTYANGKFTPFSLSRTGFGTAHLRAVGARDAFLSIQHLTYADAGRGTALDAEALLALDPEVLIMPFAVYPSYAARFAELLKLAEDPVAGRLRALRTGRVYPGGTPLQGPVFFLFQVEMTAKQLYPQVFGAFRPDHTYPPEEQLFDRAQVAQLLRGEAPK